MYIKLCDKINEEEVLDVMEGSGLTRTIFKNFKDFPIFCFFVYAGRGYDLEGAVYVTCALTEALDCEN